MAEVISKILSSGYIRPINYDPEYLKTHPIIVAIDASQSGVGAELAQVDENGVGALLDSSASTLMRYKEGTHNPSLSYSASSSACSR